MSAVLVEASDIDAPEQELDIMQQLMRCRRWIEDALEYSGLSESHQFHDICRGVLTGEFYLWHGDNGCAITEFTLYPTKKVLHVFLAGGDMQQILDFEESAAAWGKACGCSEMTIAGRKGWSKVLGNRGWKEVFTVMGREI
jgi:hypothetical protein